MLNSIRKMWWVSWLLIPLLWIMFTSGVSIHAHNVEHSHHYSDLHESIDAIGDNHSHGFTAHITADDFHHDSGNVFTDQMDLSPKGIAKNLGHTSLIPLFLIISFIFLFGGFWIFLHFQGFAFKRLKNWQFFFSPPLRAPPYSSI